MFPVTAPLQPPAAPCGSPVLTWLVSRKQLLLAEQLALAAVALQPNSAALCRSSAAAYAFDVALTKAVAR